MATAAPAGPDARDIFGEVVESLVHERPLADTLALISRRVCELGAFDFCGILLPDAEGDHVHLAASHGFPPRYVKRLNDVFLGSLRDTALAGSPTASALRRRETAVMTDALSDESFRPWRALAREFGYRSIVSAPLVVEGEVLGALNGYSAQPRDLTDDQRRTVETLAGQAALALRMTMLVDAQHETIAKLREANEQLEAQRRMLERSHDIHMRLTSAVIAGADFHAVAQTLAGLIGRPVLVTDAGGHPICTSEDPPPDPALHAGSPDALVGRIRIGAELLGSVVVEEGELSSRDLDVRAVEHAATVLALEIVKERVARATEERLRSDFLSDLLDGRDAAEERIGERARHYGLTLGAEHRVVVAAVEDDDRDRRPQALELVARALAERLPGALTGRAGDVVTAAVPTDGDERRSRARRRGGRGRAGARRGARARPARVGRHRRGRPRGARVRRLVRGRDALHRRPAAPRARGGDARRRRAGDPRPVRRQRPPAGARGARPPGPRPGPRTRRALRQRAAPDARELPRDGVRRARVRARAVRPRQHREVPPAPGAGALRARPARPPRPAARHDGAADRAAARRPRVVRLKRPWRRDLDRVLICTRGVTQ